MYAKLVVGNSNIPVLGAMRDIGRLITSEAPSISDIGAFDTTSSIIIDNTPADWTYVGSTNADDQPSIAATNASTTRTTDVIYNLCFSAPCLQGSELKYAALTTAWLHATNATSFCLTGAQDASSLGVLTNEGPRWSELAASATSDNEVKPAALLCQAGKILHVIANERHITIIEEDRGMAAVWESSQTAVHTFYGTAPFVQYTHCDTSIVDGKSNVIVPSVNTTTLNYSAQIACFAVTDPNTGIFYGTYDPTDASGNTPKTNITNLMQNTAGLRTNSITSSGLPTVVVSPVFYGLLSKGYPMQYVTGVVPVYLTAPTLASSGNIIEINGNEYLFFNSGPGFGLALQTS